MENFVKTLLKFQGQELVCYLVEVTIHRERKNRHNAPPITLKKKLVDRAEQKMGKFNGTFLQI